MSAQPSLVSSHQEARTTVRAAEFDRILAEHGQGVRVLSLDCFDTLLFRRTATPIDVFFDLQNEPSFRSVGLTAKLRAMSETRARELAQVRRGTIEVRLPDIYRAAFPRLSDAEVLELENAELAAEMRACYAFGPTVDLMRAAKAQGLRVVVVSDTYFDERQLRRLLSSALGAADLGLIDRIFCSNAFQRSKTRGLFGDVVTQLGIAASAILHLGDHPAADLAAPRAAGLRALHFVHHDEPVQQMLRLQGTAAALLCPMLRHQAPLPSPFRGFLAAEDTRADGAYLLGFAAAGPIFYAFARFILDELERLRQSGKNPKPIFLLRDAHLPAQICRALAGREVGPEIAISRFASYAASFRTIADVESYLGGFAGSQRFAAMAKQFLLPDPTAQKIAAEAAAAADPVNRFVQLITRPEVLSIIFEQSKAYRSRLLRYLERSVDLRRGDTLVIVDLGYDGTAQRLLEPMLRDELGVELLGRYLLLARTPGWEHARKGLVDPSWCDDRVIAAVVPYMALIEGMCSSYGGSVTDYDADGAPVLDANVIDPEQRAQIGPVQAMCRSFAERAERFFERVGQRPDDESLRTTALAALGRLLFLPIEQEVAFLENFRLDLNLGTSDSVRLFDRAGGLSSLRRRGLFFMEKKGKSWRTNYPIELRHAGTELALTLLIHHRYALDLGQADANLRREEVRILVIHEQQATAADTFATASFDGYFVLLLPMGRRDMNVGVLFGERYTWVQIDSVELIPTGSLWQDDESRHAEDISSDIQLDQLVPRAPGLYECLSDSAFMLIAAGARHAGNGTFACRVVFRPIAYRAEKKGISS
jgi:FMN phosphatase YigB (HAD superfamily)